jgi:hypothetical protein
VGRRNPNRHSRYERLRRGTNRPEHQGGGAFRFALHSTTHMIRYVAELFDRVLQSRLTKLHAFLLHFVRTHFCNLSKSAASKKAVRAGSIVSTS